MIFAEARVLYLDHTTATYMYCMVYILGLKKKKSRITQMLPEPAVSVLNVYSIAANFARVRSYK